MLYGIQRTDKVRQTEIAHEPNGIRATSRCKFYNRQSLGERQNHAQLSRPPHLRATV